MLVTDISSFWLLGSSAALFCQTHRGWSSGSEAFSDHVTVFMNIDLTDKERKVERASLALGLEPPCDERRTRRGPRPEGLA